MFLRQRLSEFKRYKYLTVGYVIGDPESRYLGAREMLNFILTIKKPLIVDADALNILSENCYL